MQELGTTIADFMKDKVNILGTEKCKDCGKEYRLIQFLDKDKQVRSTSEECPYCKVAREDEETIRNAVKQRRKARVERFKRYSETPFDLENANFDNYEPKNKTQEEAKKISIDFVENQLEKTTLFFQGDTGLGKTHLSYSVYKTFVDDEKGAIFIDLPSLLADIRNTFNNYNDPRAKTQESIMNAISDCDLLVLDDIGAEYVKPDANGYESWAADILFQIVNSRQGKKNIYTTNFESKYLAKKYGMMSKRIISRLMSNAKVIKVEGKDHRLQGLD